MATCVDLSGATHPVDSTPLEGRSLVPAFANKPIDREAIYWDHEGNRAIRIGDWKLVAKGPGSAWELYNIPADRGETKNLAAEQADRARSMKEKWEAYAKRAKVLPWIWTPEYK
jgi:arylsulfatase